MTPVSSSPATMFIKPEPQIPFGFTSPMTLSVGSKSDGLTANPSMAPSVASVPCFIPPPSKAGPAEQLLEDLLQHGASPAYLLAMLSRQVRLLVRAKELVRQRKSDVEIQSRLGLAPYPLRKTMEQAQRYPMERLKDVYLKLLEADLYIKRGKYDGKLALNILVAELCPPVRA